MNRDRYGLPLTTGSDSAAAFYRDGVELLLSAWCGSEQAFDKAISEDPGFALAHIARARVHQLHMEIAEARTMAALARELATIATRRERQHVAILAAAAGLLAQVKETVNVYVVEVPVPPSSSRQGERL